MPYAPYLIANYRIGLERDLKPWLLPDDAFPNIENCYLYRGVINRRGGCSLLGRLLTSYAGEVLGNHNAPAPQTFAGTLAHFPIVAGTLVITDNTTTFTDNGAGSLVVTAGSGTTGSINYNTGAYSVTFTGAATTTDVTAAYDVPTNLPVQALCVREISSVNTEDLIAFDTTYAYRFNTSTEKFQNVSGGTTWTGNDANFFWHTNYRKAFFATNYVDPIRWYTAVTTGTTWVDFQPQLTSGGTTLQSSLIILPYKDRLVVLSTKEGGALFQQRARWSQNGTPYYNTAPTGVGTDVNAWREDIIGKGGFLDAPTSENIISAGFVKDTLIVFFERSAYQLRYTGNELLPFVFEKINAELGAQSTYSSVGFDRGVFTVGQDGIISCDGVNVVRIDLQIPDQAFEFNKENSGNQRVSGIRDFYGQKVYWTYADDTGSLTFPNRMLVLNYLDGSYSIFKLSLTTLGAYYNYRITDRSWQQLVQPWSSTTIPWTSPALATGFPQLVGGNQQGFVFFLNFSDFDEDPLYNDPSLYVTNISNASGAVVTSPNHNLAAGTIIKLSQVVGMTQVNDQTYQVSSKSLATNSFILADEIGNPIDSTAYSVYSSGGVIEVLDNFDISTKRLNPFIQQGLKARLGYVDLFLQASDAGEMTVDLYIDEDYSTPVQSQVVSLEYAAGKDDERFWQRVYVGAEAQFFQIKFSFSNGQMFDGFSANSPVGINAMIFWFEPAGRDINVYL